MQVERLFDESPETAKAIQPGFKLDDGSGLRVVSARFLEEQCFDWSFFEGYESLQILTYSASCKAVIRMLDRYSFKRFECIFGYEGVLRDLKSIMSFQKVVIGDTRAAIMGLRDERHVHILERIHSGQARFYVVRKFIAHAKIYLLTASDGRTRVLIGSANLSERAFSGRQPETLIKFDNDPEAWNHYSSMFDAIRDAACDEIPLPKDRIVTAEIEVTETPVINDSSGTLVIEPPASEEIEVSFPVQIARVEKVAAALSPCISAAFPPVRSGKQRITPQVKREISRIHLVKSAEEADSRYFSIDRINRVAQLSGSQFPLEFDAQARRKDASLLLDYFKNYEDAFEGNVPRLQRDYFTLMAWLYFSPFICDMRSLALLRDSDVVRFPCFAIIFGKSNCGKTSLVDTLMTSMFGHALTIDKQSFTSAKLLGLQQSYKRLPVVFDDIGRAAFARHGRDMIKNEMQPPVEEYPGFVISMNAEPQSFPDEVVKRSMMIYTTTALPPHNEELRQRLQSKIQEMRHGLTGHLYRSYLTAMLDYLDDERLPDDWLALSSGVLIDVLAESCSQPLPGWCRPVTWLDYAEKRYDRVKARLDNLLRPSAHAKMEGEIPNGWKTEGNRIVVWEQRDVFGRRGFEWEDVPSTLIDEEASGGDRTVLHRVGVEQFLGRGVHAPRSWWKPWR